MSILPAILRRRRLAGDPYAVLGFRPDLVFDFDAERYRTSGSATTFSDAITHARASNATMVDSDGLLKWAPHNLISYSEFEGATVGVVGSGGSLPTGWEFTAALDTAEVVEISTYNGHPAIRIRIALDNTAGGSTTRSLRRTFANFITVDAGGLYTTSSEVNILSNNGSLVVVTHVETTSGDVFVDADASAAITGSGWQTATLSNSEMNATVAKLRPYPLSFTIDAGLDFEAEFWVSAPRTYRSDLGGMVNNPDTGTDYVPNSTSSPLYLPRRGHHTWDGSAWVNNGLLHESEARTNLVDNSQDPENATKFVESSMTVTYGTDDPAGGTTGVTQSAMADAADTFRLLNTTAVAVNDIYTGSMWIKMAAGETCIIAVARNGAGTFEGTTKQVTGTGQWVRESVSHTFANVQTGSRVEIYYGGTNAATSVEWAWPQIEKVTAANPFPSSYIPTYGATATRAAETLTIPAANLPWPEPVVIGPELVTNGTFDTNADFWIVRDGAVKSVSGGQLTVTGDGGFNDRVDQVIQTTSGNVYRVTGDAISGDWRVVARKNGGAFSVLASQNGSGAAPVEFFFVAVSSETVIQLYSNTTDGAAAVYDNVSVREIDPLAVSIAMEGKVSYGDDNAFGTVLLWRWQDTADNSLQSNIDCVGTTGNVIFRSAEGGTQDFPIGTIEYTPDILVPFNIASRHGSTFINGAVDGVALTANTTPTALPDLETTDLSLGVVFNGTIASLRIWDEDIGETGIEEASA